MSAITQNQINMMRTRLGARRSRWAQQGVEFLIYRSGGRGDDASLFEHLFNMYLAGDFDSCNPATANAAMRHCGLDRLGPEETLMLLLGRRPRSSQSGIQQQHSRSLTFSETQGQVLLAEALSGGRRYMNKRRVTAVSQPIAREPRHVGSVVPASPNALFTVAAPSTAGRSRCVENRAHLIEALKNRPDYMNQRLAELKEETWRFERPDFLWHALLQSFSTMQSSRGYAGLIQNSDNYSQVTYAALDTLSLSQRQSRLDTVLQRAKVRMATKKAGWLVENFDRIAAMGGPDAAKQLAAAQQGTEAKIHFVSQFVGIGPKYARNLWMDVYHPDFRESVAIDARIKKLSLAMGCEFISYEEHERFYLEIAHEVGLEGWELDRLLYNFLDYFLKQCSARS